MKLLLLSFLTLLHVIPSKLQACGRFSFSTGLIVNGDEVKRGEFPFLVALLMLRTQKFFCGATLITQKHALTAAHCIHTKDVTSVLEPEDIVAQLGRYNLKQQHERGMVSMDVKEIKIHPDWKSYATRYDADIAVLVFTKEVELSEFIKTICLPMSSQAQSLGEGEVVGWGYSEKSNLTKVEEVPKKIKLKAPPSNELCFLTEPLLAPISSNRTFCAGGEKTGPCNGDSGGGFYRKSDSTWYLQGIVSSSLVNINNECDVTNYAVYTNVAHFSSWVWEIVNGLKQLALPCVFDYATNLKNKHYYCETQLVIKTDDVVLSSAYGTHKDGKSISDVKLLDMGSNNDKNLDLYFIPSGISDVFPYLRILYIQDCKLTRLSRKNFKRMNELSTISVTNNLISSIDEDTFYEVPMLFSLRVNSNRLKSLANDIFIHSIRLQHFIFDTNQIETFDGNIFRNCPLLVGIVLEDNKLNKIRINLTSFKSLIKVDLRNNLCINAFFGKGSTTTLQGLQDDISKNC